MSLAKFILLMMGFLVFGVMKATAAEELTFIVTESKRADRACAIQQIEEFQKLLARNPTLANRINNNVDQVEIAVFSSRWENKAPPRATYLKKDRRLVLLSTYLERQEICKTVSPREIMDQSRLIAQANVDYDKIIRRKGQEINASLGRTSPEQSGRMPASMGKPRVAE